MSPWGQCLTLLQLQNTYEVVRENIVVLFMTHSFPAIFQLGSDICK